MMVYCMVEKSRLCDTLSGGERDKAGSEAHRGQVVNVVPGIYPRIPRRRSGICFICAGSESHR